MPRKKTSTPVPPQVGYAAWKARVKEQIQRAGLPAGTLLERDLRNLFIAGMSPEQAVGSAETIAHNARPPLGGKRR